MLIAIDGTGPYDQQEYDMGMARSFCVQLSQTIKSAHYFYGPGGAGLTTRGKANSAYYLVHSQRKKDEPVYLAGYSRGGATAIHLAKILAAPEEGYPRINVKAMFLFDPVTRDLSLNADGIPENVRNCYVIFRDRKCEEVNSPWKPNYGYGDWPDRDIYARKWMGNSGTDAMNSSMTRVQRAVIEQASHGAVGGVPWTERVADKKGCDMAADWMNAMLAAEGLPAKLRNMWSVEKKPGKAAAR